MYLRGKILTAGSALPEEAFDPTGHLLWRTSENCCIFE
jgi:hypothetical protein